MSTTLPKALRLAVLALALLPAVVRAEQKIAVVDLQRALDEIDEGRATKATLTKDKDEKQKQLDGKKAEFERLSADFEKQQSVLNDAAKREKIADLDRRGRELQGLLMQLQKDLSERERDAMKVLFDKMTAIVREISEADGFTVVLEKSAGVVYAQPSLDITNELIRKYNQRHPGAGGGKKAAAGKGDAKAAGKK
jgi:outer membrane protein